VADTLDQIAERLRAYVRLYSTGACRVLSAGSDCICPLCDIDCLRQQVWEARADALREAADAIAQDGIESFRRDLLCESDVVDWLRARATEASKDHHQRTEG
jgi:hypothetical protein